MIPAIVLAAGKSTRMGRPKALLPLDGNDTFLTRVVRTLLDAGVDDVVVVVGHEAPAIVEHLAISGQRARFVVNTDYERGQLTSLVAGLNLVDRPGATATLVMPVDVPLVSPATVRAVIDRYRATGVAVVRPTRGGRHGHPVLIDRRVFESLRRADPTEGARPIVRAHASRGSDVEVDDDGAFADIDTPEEYEQVVRMSGSSAASRRAIESGGDESL